MWFAPQQQVLAGQTNKITEQIGILKKFFFNFC